ncbi:cyclohexanecarboxylate-CoA ligase [Pseudonocardia autotrophica]|uniref:Short-chain-fatty-acid--CoA ligase n=2 Tax=Pseudonocardia TaxID=1847 RepID=A0A1Y2MPE5_PSEAH|nr:Short-chain-fatty-acid--CoA ligase [Pseudonocardia autotrophica]TDN72075.1 cyclohexanecarboxylate-CoA ligase [Pseudonocardia autotrophica]BBG02773.1 short chain acyl-CoA synthetase [Pseudonocardia autotrophica]GEC25894.1 short chain acyl-CoA synthetase [Pseudonocardia saturnea]
MRIPTVSDRYSAVEVQENYDSGCWSTETFGALLDRQAGRRGEATFVTDGTQSLTYRELRDRSAQLAVGLRDRGVSPGDRVAVQLPNWAEFVLVAAALARLGAIMVPIMPIYRRDEVGYVLDDAEVSAVVTPASFKGFDHLAMFRDLARDRPSLHTLLVVRADVQPAEPAVTLDAVTADVDPAEALASLGTPVTADDPFVIVYTSGTTARPKGCVHTFNTYAAGARMLNEAFAVTASDVGFSPSPITHTTGLVTGVLMPLLAGGATHVMAEWEPCRGLEEIARHRCSLSVTATTFLQMALSAFDPAEHDASSLRVWVCAGAPIPGSVVERARALLPSAKILSLYGRSENLTTTACTVDDDPERSLTSDGASLPHAAVRVVDETGAELPTGEEGDIAYRGPNHMLGYLGLPRETAELYTPDGFSRSGDLGRSDADGYVRVTGRTKDIVIRGGMNISVREVEDLLAEHPAVGAAAVVGMPDARLGERVCCYVVPADPADPPSLESLRRYLHERGVAVQKTPERVETVTELPTTATGKIQKHLLRKDIARKLEQVPAT